MRLRPALELDGEDLRREPIETRKSTLKSLLRGKHAGIALHRGWRNRLPAGLCARLRGHRVEAAGIPVSLRSRRRLGEGKESGRAGGHARGRGGLELTNCAVKICKWLNNGPPYHSATFGRNRGADANGENQIAQQRRLVAELETNGSPASHTKYLLAGLELLQTARRDSRQWLLKQLGGQAEK